MLKLLNSVFNAGRQLVCAGCLLALLLFLFPAITLAAPPHDEPVGAENCVKCHQQETDAWQTSPHAQASTNQQMAGATCEDCHGLYVDEHPDKDVMQLSVDSSICNQCHSDTFNQWEHSTHAQAGVQCISCHLSHSQDFRLTDEKLCGACHRDELGDYSHSAHGAADVTCTDCHASTTSAGQVVQVSQDEGQVKNVILAPNHDFTHVASSNCVQCHGQDIHALAPRVERVDSNLLAMANSVPQLKTSLETVRQSNKSLQVLVPVSLGLGIGAGGMLGIAFMLAIEYFSRKRGQK